MNKSHTDCVNTIVTPDAEVWLRSKARLLHDRAARLERLADYVTNLDKTAQQALFELAD